MWKPLKHGAAAASGVAAEGITAYLIPSLAWVLGIGCLALAVGAFILLVIVLFTSNETPYTRLRRLLRGDTHDQPEATQLPGTKDETHSEAADRSGT